MPLKVCEVVSAQKLIRAGEDAGSWETEQPKPSISSSSFAESNLHIFPVFLNRWSCLGRCWNMTELEGFAAYVWCVFGWSSMKVQASVKYSASCDLDRSEHNSRFNSRLYTFRHRKFSVRGRLCGFRGGGGLTGGGLASRRRVGFSGPPQMAQRIVSRIRGRSRSR